MLAQADGRLLYRIFLRHYMDNHGTEDPVIYCSMYLDISITFRYASNLAVLHRCHRLIEAGPYQCAVGIMRWLRIQAGINRYLFAYTHFYCILT